MEKGDFFRKQYITVPDAHISNRNLLLILLNHCRVVVRKRISPSMMQGGVIYQNVARCQRKDPNDTTNPAYAQQAL
jgi:hypothetical protein